MIVFVESNFVVESALEQEECAHVETILVAAESGTVDLVIPAFSVAEPISTVMGRRRERAKKLRPVSEIGERRASRARPVNFLRLADIASGGSVHDLATFIL